MLARGRAEYVKSEKPSEMLDRLTSEQAAQLPSPRILNTHVPFTHLPTQAIQVLSAGSACGLVRWLTDWLTDCAYCWFR